MYSIWQYDKDQMKPTVWSSWLTVPPRKPAEEFVSAKCSRKQHGVLVIWSGMQHKVMNCTVSLSAGPLLWSRLKCLKLVEFWTVMVPRESIMVMLRCWHVWLNNYWMGCHQMWDSHSVSWEWHLAPPAGQHFHMCCQILLIISSNSFYKAVNSWT